MELRGARKFANPGNKDYGNPMSKLEDARRAAAEAAQRRAKQVETTPPEGESEDAEDLADVRACRNELCTPWDEARREVELEESPADATFARVIQIPIRGRPKGRVEPKLPFTVKMTMGERDALEKACPKGKHLSVWAREVLLREAGK